MSQQNELRDWERNQLLNFSHGNHQFPRYAPRLAREVLGTSLPREEEAAIRDFLKGVAIGLLLVAIVVSLVGGLV